MSQLRVDVTDAEGRPLDNAVVQLTDSTRETHHLEFDKNTDAYLAAKGQPGLAVVTVEHPDYEAQTRNVLVAEGENSELFMLAKPGVPTLLPGKVRVGHRREGPDRGHPGPLGAQGTAAG
ncbi:MAG: hypothetical protein IPL43_13035 [Micropruina sp.]|nr:hypothetical protein [Micropruina sp.]